MHEIITQLKRNTQQEKNGRMNIVVLTPCCGQMLKISLWQKNIKYLNPLKKVENIWVGFIKIQKGSVQYTILYNSRRHRSRRYYGHGDIYNWSWYLNFHDWAATQYKQTLTPCGQSIKKVSSVLTSWKLFRLLWFCKIIARIFSNI